MDYVNSRLTTAYDSLNPPAEYERFYVDLAGTASKSILDVGCGDGALLEHLVRTKHVDGRGIELSQQNVNACVARGLSVMQGDADADLVEYPSGAFDAVILSNTIQATERPRAVLEHLLRIGRRTAVSLPNFGYWKVRGSLVFDLNCVRMAKVSYSCPIFG